MFLQIIHAFDQDLLQNNRNFHILFVQGYASNNTFPEFASSGAYVFRPLFSEALPVSLLRHM